MHGEHGRVQVLVLALQLVRPRREAPHARLAVFWSGTRLGDGIGGGADGHGRGAQRHGVRDNPLNELHAFCWT